MLYREKCCAAKVISLTRSLAVKTVSYIAPVDVEGARFSDLGQLFACAKFRRTLRDLARLSLPGS